MLTGTFPPTTNRQDWTVFYEITDAETGELFDLSTATEITVEVRDPADKSSTVSGTMTDGHVILTDGSPFPVTMTIATPAVDTAVDHGLALDDVVIFDASGALPTGVTAG